MKFYILNETDGRITVLHRDVCHAHPQWVHDQCGSSSESELQGMLDQYDETALGQGRDEAGIECLPDGVHAMTESEAIEKVYSINEQMDHLDDSELRELFAALHGREATDEDVENHLWSQICAACPNCGNRP